MKIKCLHGYFIFEEQRAGDVSSFINRYGLELEPIAEYFTFTKLVDAPDFSLKGKTYLGALATKNFAGRPWEIMRENQLVYNFNTGLVVTINSIVQTAAVAQAGKYYISQGLILPGSLLENGARVTDYSAWFSFDTLKFKYSEVTVE